MPRINLLPWRDTLQKERETRFGIIAIIMLIFAGLVVGAVHLYMSGEIDYQKRRNNYLIAEIKKAKDKIKEIKELEQKKQRLIERMSIIQKLEESRPQVVHLFEELVKQVPEGVYFTSMKQKANKIVLEGAAQSNARVSTLMKNFERSQWLTGSKIIFIKTERLKGKQKSYRKRSVSKFKLEITQTAPKKKEQPL
jgi:type IV pilus assembly protein PilN